MSEQDDRGPSAVGPEWFRECRTGLSVDAWTLVVAKLPSQGDDVVQPTPAPSVSRVVDRPPATRVTLAGSSVAPADEPPGDLDRACRASHGTAGGRIPPSRRGYAVAAMSDARPSLR